MGAFPPQLQEEAGGGGGISERLVASSLSWASPGKALSGSFWAKLTADPKELSTASGIGAATTQGQWGAAPGANISLGFPGLLHPGGAPSTGDGTCSSLGLMCIRFLTNYFTHLLS